MGSLALVPHCGRASGRFNKRFCGLAAERPEIGHRVLFGRRLRFATHHAGDSILVCNLDVHGMGVAATTRHRDAHGRSRQRPAIILAGATNCSSAVRAWRRERMAMPEHIITETRDRVQRIELHRPDKRNAITVAMYEAMAAALVRAGEDPGVR